MQTEVVRLALDLLVREPDIEGFFGALSKTMVEESESHTCAVWLIDDDWAALRSVDGLREGSAVHAAEGSTRARQDDDPEDGVPVREHGRLTCSHYTPGWNETIEYDSRRCRACPSRSGRSAAAWTGAASSPRRCCSAAAISAG